MPTFDVIDEPWLDVLKSDGRIETLPLRKVLKELHQIERLSEASPLTEVALLRFLIALVSDGLRGFIPGESEWLPFTQRCRGGLLMTQSMRSWNHCVNHRMSSQMTIRGSLTGLWYGRSRAGTS